MNLEKTNSKINSQSCKWKNVETFYADYWDSECGISWQLECGNLKENNMNYCPKCGRKIEEEAE